MIWFDMIYDMVWYEIRWEEKRREEKDHKKSFYDEEKIFMTSGHKYLTIH